VRATLHGIGAIVTVVIISAIVILCRSLIGQERANSHLRHYTVYNL
jgi:hypothetical protein